MGVGEPGALPQLLHDWYAFSSTSFKPVSFPFLGLGPLATSNLIYQSKIPEGKDLQCPTCRHVNSHVILAT